MNKEKTIKEYLSALKNILENHPEKSEILENVERQIHDRLSERDASPDNPESVEAVLSEMDPPEAWISAIEQETEAKSAPESKWHLRFKIASIVSSLSGIIGQFFVTKINGIYIPFWLLFLIMGIVLAILSISRGARWIAGICTILGLILFLTINAMVPG